jgi:MFS transporter, FHS family, L-fucose permease
MSENLSAQNPTKKSILPPIMVMGLFFAIFGFITWLNSVLIPYLKIACELSQTSQYEQYLVTFAFFISYTIMALPASFLLEQTGFKRGMVIGLGIIALGCLVFIPAAQARNFNLFLVGIFIQGAGLALLQTAVNPYVAVLGAPESAAQRISLMGICNKFAGIIAPPLMGYILLKDSDKLEASLKTLPLAIKNEQLQLLANKVIMPYGILTAFVLLIAGLLYFIYLPELNLNNPEKSSANNNIQTNKTSILQFPSVFLGAFAIFAYVGAEVIVGDTIISYAKNLSYTSEEATLFPSLALVAMLVGYVVAIFAIPKYISQEESLIVCVALGVVFMLGTVFLKGDLSIYSLALLGLANSVMWPAIFPLGIAKLGKFTEKGSAIMIMGISGGAVLPLVYGFMANLVGLQQAYWVLLPCYLYILYFALIGHKK